MFFKSIKVNYRKGILKQVKFCGKTVLQYEKTVDEENPYTKEIQITFPFKKKPNIDKKMFYLKVNNRNYGYSIMCLQQWINLIEQMDADYYIICDDEEVEKTILENISFSKSDIKFIKSDRKTYSPLLNMLCSKMFHNKAFAHLTAYTHAKSNNIKYYWDIDADDIYLFMSTKKLQELLEKAEEIAIEKNFHALSYDTDRSATLGLTWKMGITFVKVADEFDELLYSVNPIDLRNYYLNYFAQKSSDLNGIFTYLKALGIMWLGTFNAPNVYCLNWGMCNFRDFSRMLQVADLPNEILPVHDMLDKNRTQKHELSPDIISIDISMPKNLSKNIMNNMLLNYSNYLDICLRRSNQIVMNNIIFKNTLKSPSKQTILSKIKKLFKIDKKQ